MQFNLCNSNCANFLLCLFSNLSIGEAVGTPPPDPFFFAGSRCSVDAPKIRQTRYRQLAPSVGIE